MRAQQYVVLAWATLMVTFGVVTLVAMSRAVIEARSVAQERRKREGRICQRLFHRHMISALDKKLIAQGWYRHHNTYTRGLEKEIMVDYYNTFYQVPDKSIDYATLGPMMKGLAKGLRSDPTLNLFMDFMITLRKCVHDDHYFNAPKRKKLWHAYWKKPKHKKIWQHHFGSNLG